MGRSIEIRRNILRLEERLSAACDRGGRERGDVTVVAVSKRFPVEDIARAYDAGIRDFGENRVQELVEKMAEWEDRFPERPITWHMVGHLQRNKVRSVVGRVPLFHGLDSIRLAKAIDRVATEMGIVSSCLLQVNVSGEETKFGVPEDRVEEMLACIGRLDGISVQGLMTLARPVNDPEDARPELARLGRLFERCRNVADRPLSVLSMGMSGDFEVAVEEGSTHVRLGTIIFGHRAV